MSPSESARSLGRVHQGKAREQVKVDVDRRDDIIVGADDNIVIEEDDIMTDDAIHEILD